MVGSANAGEALRYATVEVVPLQTECFAAGAHGVPDLEARGTIDAKHAKNKIQFKAGLRSHAILPRLRSQVFFSRLQSRLLLI